MQCPCSFSSSVSLFNELNSCCYLPLVVMFLALQTPCHDVNHISPEQFIFFTLRDMCQSVLFFPQIPSDQLCCCYITQQGTDAKTFGIITNMIHISFSHGYKCLFRRLNFLCLSVTCLPYVLCVFPIPCIQEYFHIFNSFNLIHTFNFNIISLYKTNVCGRD